MSVLRHNGQLAVGRRALTATAFCVTAACLFGTSAVAIAAPDVAPTVPLVWTACTEGDVADLECSSIPVPLDHASPAGPSIKVGIYRLALPAGTSRPGKVLFVNPGGPGGETGSLVQFAAVQYPSEVLATYDIVGVDPRGTGTSTHVSCVDADATFGPVPDARPFPRERLTELLAKSAAYTTECFRRSGDLMPFISTSQTAQDLDLVRKSLGVPTASFLGYSYGTVLFSHYARLFPQHVDKLVLDSAVYGRDWGWEFYEDRGPRFEARLEEFADWAGRNSNVFAIGHTAQDVLGTYEEVITSLSEEQTAEGLGIGAGDIQLIANQAAQSSQNFPLLALFLSIANQFTSSELPKVQGQALLAEIRDAARTMGDDSASATMHGVLCNDGPFPERDATYLRAARKAERHYPRLGALQVVPSPCASWPLRPHRPLPVSRGKLTTPPLVVQATGDPATPYEQGETLARRIGASLLSVDSGDHTHFGLPGEECTTATVTRYLLEGRLPARGTVCAGAPLPSFALNLFATPGSALTLQDRATALTAEVVARAQRNLHFR